MQFVKPPLACGMGALDSSSLLECTSLDLQGALHNATADATVARLAELLRVPGGSPRLGSVLLADNPIGETGLDLLVPALVGHASLRHIKLDACGIGASGAATLAAALAMGANWSTLSLSWNPIGPNGAAALAAAIAAPATPLARLHLGNCQLGGIGAKSLASALGNGSRLSALTLDQNRIRDDGAIALADALAANAHLRALDLGYNNIGEPGAVSLARGLARNRALGKSELPLPMGAGSRGRAPITDGRVWSRHHLT